MKIKVKESLKLLSFSLITLFLFTALLHGVFVGLCKINKIPNFRFNTFLDPNFRLDNPNLEKELTEGDILIYLPQSKLRKSTPDGLTVKFGGENVTYFSGYRRTSPITKEKPIKTKRIISIGDSFTWGWKVSNENTIPHQLETILNQNKSQDFDKIEVLNAGMTASTITNSYEGLKNYDVNFSPDVVILTFCENDIGDLKQKNSTDAFTYELLKKYGWFGPIRFFVAGKYQKERKLLAKQLKEMKQTELIGGRFGIKPHLTHIKWPRDIKTFLNTPIEKQDVKNLILRNYLMTESKITPFTRKEDIETWELWKEWEETLVKLKKLSEEKKFKLVIFTFPLFSRIHEPEFDNQNTPENIIDSICKKYGVTHINPLLRFRQEDLKMRRENKFIYMFPEDDHPTVEGNNLAAKILAEEILPLLLNSRN